MNGYPKEELLDLLAEFRRKARLAFSSDKLIAVLKMINDLEIEMLNGPSSSQMVIMGGTYKKGDYRKEDERIPLPNPNYELGN